MANLSDIFFRTTINGTTQNLSISGVKNIWDGVDGRWGGEASTPYELGMNQKTGQAWTPKAVPPTLLLSGGDLPQVLDRSVGVVSETLPIQIWAESYDDAVYLKTFLQRFLLNGQYEAPVTLWVKPYGATNYVVFEVLDGIVQELPSFINDEAGRGVLRTNVTITRQGWGTADYEAGVFSSVPATIGNSPFTSPANLIAMDASAITGDTAYTGQPMNMEIRASRQRRPATRLWLATLADEWHSGNSTTTYSTTNTGGQLKVVNSITVPSAALNPLVQPRCIVRVASASSNVQVRAVVQTPAGTSLAVSTLMTSDWQTPAASTTLIDFGTWPLDIFRRSRSSVPSLQILLYIRSTDGASASVQLSWTQMLCYYEFCRIDTYIDDALAQRQKIDMYTDANSYHPRLIPPTATIYWASALSPAAFADVRGTLPRYRNLPNTGGLWMAWLDDVSTHQSSEQMSVTAYRMPLYASLRGGL